MSDSSPVHLWPPQGSRILPCCHRTVDAEDLAVIGRLTTLTREVTCNEREIAQLVVDNDDGESPFGWRENDSLTRAIPRNPLPDTGSYS